MAKIRESGLLAGISGRSGNLVFVSTAQGTIVRDAPRINDPRSSAQIAARERIAKSGHAWKSMTIEEANAWRIYAKLESGNGSGPANSGQAIFNRCTLKFLQAQPNGVIPINPPASLFPGDGVRLTVASIDGELIVEGDRNNSDGVVTEILVQELESVHRRTYLQRYRAVGFWTINHDLPLAIPLGTGIYAVASRFVYKATGQYTSILEHGVIQI